MLLLYAFLLLVHYAVRGSYKLVSFDEFKVETRVLGKGFACFLSHFSLFRCAL